MTMLPASRSRGLPAAPLAACVGLGIAALSWALVPVFQKQLLAVLSPAEITFVRFFASGVMLLGILVVTRPRELYEVVRRSPCGVLATSICGPLLAMSAFTFGIQTVGVGLAAVIVATEPMLTYLIAVGLGRERWSPSRALSILLSFAGLAGVVTADGGGGGVYWLGLAAVCLTPAVWAVNTVISKDLVDGSSSVALVTVNFLVSSMCLAPFVGFDGLARLEVMGRSDWLALGFCIVPGTVISYCIWYALLRFLTPSTLSVSLYVIPVFTVLASVAVLDEQLSIMKTAGIAVVLYGLYLVTLKHDGD